MLLQDVRQLQRRRVLHLECGKVRALERPAQVRLGDPEPVRDEVEVRLGEEQAAVRRGLDVHDDERAARLEEGREEARHVLEGGEVVERCGALLQEGGGGRGR